MNFMFKLYPDLNCTVTVRQERQALQCLKRENGTLCLMPVWASAQFVILHPLEMTLKLTEEARRAGRQLRCVSEGPFVCVYWEPTPALGTWMKEVSAVRSGSLWKILPAGFNFRTLACFIQTDSHHTSFFLSFFFCPFHPWPHYPLPFTCWKERGMKLAGGEEGSWIKSCMWQKPVKIFLKGFPLKLWDGETSGGRQCSRNLIEFLSPSIDVSGTRL